MKATCIYSLLLILLLSACQTSQKTPISNTKNTEKIDSLHYKADEYMQALTNLGKFNGVVLLEKNNKIVLQKAYNISQKPLDSLPSLWVEKNYQFDLRSIAKLFAKASVIKLENEGRLNRNDFIEKYISNFPNGNKITIEHLMHNRSGLPREFTTNNDNCLELGSDEIIALAKKEKLEFEPNTDERYSNVGFQLLYYVISKISQKSYHNYLKEAFFEPLEMKNSGGHFDFDNSNLKNYAYGHYKKDKKLIPILEFPKDDCKVGHLYSTVEDLSKFINHLENEPYFSALQDKNIIGHAGGTQGKRAYVFKNYEKEYSIVFLTNYDEIPFQQITEDLKNILEGKPYQIPKEVNRTAIEIPQNILSNYEGTYDFAEIEHLKLKFVVEKDTLVAYQDGKFSGKLLAENDSTFFWDKKSAESIIFQKNENNEYKVLMDFKGAKWEGLKVE
ncbi:serine hydrolase domain-containing protein [Bernardetia sp.]|uniref:serine hydrolase domain-containing protein n=1 Tax=Bernardetia sp. TaxID=1937974 RepID=UPI0025C6E176|nr:serine hydrolase domain-containing protein [Bernardetia sp.]